MLAIPYSLAKLGISRQRSQEEKGAMPADVILQLYRQRGTVYSFKVIHTQHGFPCSPLPDTRYAWRTTVVLKESDHEELIDGDRNGLPFFSSRRAKGQQVEFHPLPVCSSFHHQEQYQGKQDLSSADVQWVYFRVDIAWIELCATGECHIVQGLVHWPIGTIL